MKRTLSYAFRHLRESFGLFGNIVDEFNDLCRGPVFFHQVFDQFCQGEVIDFDFCGGGRFDVFGSLDFFSHGQYLLLQGTGEKWKSQVIAAQFAS